MSDGLEGSHTARPAAESFELVSQLVLAAARNAANSGDQRVIHPFAGRPERDPHRPLKIGLFGNMGNQAYIAARCLRRLGHDVDVVVQGNLIDHHHLSQPFWEEVDLELSDPVGVAAAPEGWEPPPFVRRIDYDLDMQVRYQNRLSAVPEVKCLYTDLTRATLSDDLALLLCQWMGHWSFIEAMNDYDVVQLSTWPIVLGPFCPKPYVVCPLGGELYITAFETNVQGLLCRAGFRGASHVAVAETDYPIYLDRLGAASPRSFMPLLVDTDIYREEPNEALRAEWHARIGGSRYLLSVCRQSWEWKGSDRLIRAFARFHGREGGDWRLLLQGWGSDLEASRALVSELQLDGVVLWLPMCSKPMLRARQRAADAVADQFVMEGYGTSVLESMAAGKPVVMSPVPSQSHHFFEAGPPPLIGAKSQEEIEDALRRLGDDAFRMDAGRRSRRWVEEEHGYGRIVPRFLAMCGRARAWSTIEESRAHDASLTAVDRLTSLLSDVHHKRRDEIRAAWARTLPFADAITDRWEKARHLGFGDGTSVYDSTLVIGDVEVGERTWIGPNCVLDGSGGLAIGSTCSISAGCQIYSHDTVAWAVSGGVAQPHRAATTIGDAVYIGPGTIVAAGSRVGAHSIIGALSLVRGEIPPYAFAVGTPARVIGRVVVAADGQVSVDTRLQL